MSLVCGGASCTTVKIILRTFGSILSLHDRPRNCMGGAIPVIPDDGPRFKYIRAVDLRWPESSWGGGWGAGRV